MLKRLQYNRLMTGEKAGRQAGDKERLIAGTLARAARVLVSSMLILIPTSQAIALTYVDCVNLSKPNIEAYDDYNTFMVDILSYKKDKRSCKKIIEQKAAEPVVDTGPNADRIIISDKTGMEDLNEAVRNAKTFAHPVYEEPLRFNRTTSQSFALPQVKTLDMSGEYINGALEEMDKEKTRALSEHEMAMEEFAFGVIEDEALVSFDKENVEKNDLVRRSQAGAASNGSSICDANSTTCLIQYSDDPMLRAEHLVQNPGGATGYVYFDVEYN